MVTANGREKLKRTGTVKKTVTVIRTGMVMERKRLLEWER